MLGIFGQESDPLLDARFAGVAFTFYALIFFYCGTLEVRICLDSAKSATWFF